MRAFITQNETAPRLATNTVFINITLMVFTNRGHSGSSATSSGMN
jgi:hypothetical protein